MTDLRVESLTCEYRTNLLGSDVKHPRISWKLATEQRGTVQKAYQIQVTEFDFRSGVGSTSGTAGDFANPIWDTGIVESDQSIHVTYQGPALQSRTRYLYRVKVWDNYGRESDWSYAWWETGLFETSEWNAHWITPDPAQIDPLSEPAFLIRKEFPLKSGIVSARIYATGVGLYEIHLNGERVGEALLTPGWTSYKHRLQYQTYDVTEQVKENQNAIGIVLADGWYKGTMGFEGKRHIYGDRRAALLQLHVRYADGSEELVITDSSWKANTGPILYSEIYHGETYDASKEITGWSQEGLDDTDWKGVQILDLPKSHLIAQENWPTSVTETIRPVASFVTPAGDTVLDMGQNMVGRIRMTVQAPKGTRIVLKHAEVLDRDGNIYFGNLRTAKQTVTYIAKGEGTEVYAPSFTFQGFRYVKVEGYPNQENGVPLDCFLGEVIHSDMEPIGDFECSNPLVNQLQKNIQWGQRGNFVDVPTDCPQRDERLGWTGDAQVFIRTALFNYQGGPFFTKWLHDLKADQGADGRVPFVIPNIVGPETSAAWGDAAVICPWTVYLCYGDTRILEDQYESMKAWIDYIHSQGDNPYLWNTGFHFGDWLGLDAKEGSYVGATPRDLVATAYYAYSARLLHQAAVVLGREEDAQTYGELAMRVNEEFNKEFVTPYGRLSSPTQTAHVLALMFDLVDGEAKERIAYNLNQLILENDYHLTTGFVGTPYLCFVLSDNGYHQTALKLLLQESYPGWLYSVTKGATTIWEHWDGIKPDGTFWSDDMNSYNHYAYGAIGDWMYRYVAGLDMDESQPAYKRIRIQPKISGTKLSYAKAVHQSMYGTIVSGWHVQGDRITVDVQIPANTTAEIVLQGADVKTLREGGNDLSAAEGIQSFVESNEGVRLVVGSGTYQFVYNNEELTTPQYSFDTLVLDLLDQEQTREVLLRHIPELGGVMGSEFAKTKTLGQLIEMPMPVIKEEQVQSILDELAALTKVTV